MKYILILSFVILVLTSCSTKTAQSQFDFANTMAKHQLWKEALARWEKLIPKMENSAKLHNNLAIAYERLGDFERAESEYKLALKLDPKNTFIKNNYNRFKKKGVKKKNEKKRDNKKHRKQNK